MYINFSPQRITFLVLSGDTVFSCHLLFLHHVFVFNFYIHSTGAGDKGRPSAGDVSVQNCLQSPWRSYWSW